ncbi:alpha-L-fucosidase [Aspergillus homomorphus CBS 101889]|uniref:alpha-L-fucosidase n=1 Tax=Aspergillus homomorphus (strain CBS 101889) TaxID=1450537 RepID=A0A395HK27_ASPHC|nr:alpha-L-fucosidase [Aspergillus homomorphus CBS 101889]RAL08282.1 alpha-L-fucosidase [Aspergillus homomorphus CBS 101889]
MKYAVLPWAVLAGSAASVAVHPNSSSTLVSLEPYFNNKAFGQYPGEALFNSVNESYPDPRILGINGSYTSSHTGIVYAFPGYRSGMLPDNVVCAGQSITVPRGRYLSASMLVSADVQLKTVSGNVTYSYSDNTTMVSELRSLPWWAFLTINRGEIIFPYRYTPNDTNFNTSHIFEYTAALDPSKSLQSVTLPVTTNATKSRLHVFALSLWPATASASAQVQFVRPTQKWTEQGNQVVELTINNPGTGCISGAGLTASLDMAGIVTAEPGHIRRLCPGDQKRVNLGVNGTANGTATIQLTYKDAILDTHTANLSLGLTNYTSDLESLARHESPEWFDDAKFGIFIHWGPYSVPGWGNSTPWESYAEWFWWYTTHPAADKSATQAYRLRTFGREWNYDDSFANFTAAYFDAKAWVDLIAAAGAKYFVLTTKHHDGFALFDTGNTSHRNSLHYGPRRDLLAELFNASATYHPTLRRGTYFSLPEWFNPDFAPYGFAELPGNKSTSWPGLPAVNPFTGREEPYTGRLPLALPGVPNASSTTRPSTTTPSTAHTEANYLTSLQHPQMHTLATTYSTDIMWCDCGAANTTAPFAAEWFNTARATHNRAVAINSRCGLAQTADFDTPEYKTFSSPQRRKWETNMGMDPYSYGYNRATAPESYMNASAIVVRLVDIVSKNGNLLLDIGPRADGTIVGEEERALREAGGWIAAHGEAVFGTRYWFFAAEGNGGSVRFTQSEEAFFVLFLERPDTSRGVVVEAPLPLLQGDRVTVLRGEGNDQEVRWEKLDMHRGFVFHVPGEAWQGERYCWVLKIEYRA